MLLFVGIFSRMIPSQALMPAIPDQTQRGSFNVVSASLQQLSGDLGSVLAAAIISQRPVGSLLHFGADRQDHDYHAGRDVFCTKSVAARAGTRVV